MNVFQMCGIAFIPDNAKPDIDRESDAKTLVGTHVVKLYRRNFKKWDTLTLHNYVNDSYVYLGCGKSLFSPNWKRGAHSTFRGAVNKL
jgi:hypothetical protein